MPEINEETNEKIEFKDLIVPSCKSRKDAFYEAAKFALLNNVNVHIIYNREKIELKFRDAIYVASYHEVLKKMESLKNILVFHEESAKSVQEKIKEEEIFLQKFYLSKWI